MVDFIQQWLSTNLLPVIFTILAAMFVARFGSIPIAAFIRRTVTYRAHGDKTEQDVKKRQDTLISICVAILKVLVWVTAGYDIIKRFGIDPAPLLAGAGVVGFAVAFGAQSLIKDFVSGVFIILENQYRVGDTATLNGATGTIERITIRTTVLRDEDGSVHYIPNGTISHSVNKTMGYAKVNLTLAVDPKTDVDKLAEIVNKTGEKMYHDEKWSKKLMEQPHFLNIGSFSDKAVELKVTGKVSPTSKWNVNNELKKRLLSTFEKHGIKVVELPPKKKEKEEATH
jgi:moderate conductance mechanosensitive channel